MKFHKGQRVRVIYAPNVPQVIGKEATIIGPGEMDDYAVDIDGMPPPKGIFFQVHHWEGAECCFAPIQDGRQLVSWSECAWQPNQTEVTA